MKLKELLGTLPVKVAHPKWAPGHFVTISHYDSATDVALGSEISGDGITKMPVEIDALAEGFEIYSPRSHLSPSDEKYYLWRHKLTGELRTYPPGETPYYAGAHEYWLPFSMSQVIPHE